MTIQPTTSERRILLGGVAGSAAAVAVVLFLLLWGIPHPATPGTGPTSPAARWTSDLVYDPADHYALLFGGANLTGYLGDTWTYAGGAWTLVSPSTHPSPRGAQAMVFDAADGYVLLFGGATVAGSSVLNDTWTFSGGAWNQLSTPVAPSPRYGAGIAYDAVDGYVVLFGGDNGHGGLLGDTWKFAHGSWVPLSPPGPTPPPRRSPGMTFDVADGYALMFGGLGDVDLADTWAFSHGSWTQVNSALPPEVRVAPGLTFDSRDGYAFLFGGRDDNWHRMLGDTWSFLGGQWTQLWPASSPTPRDWPSLAYVASDQKVVMFGGAARYGSPPPCLNDTWVFVGGNWS